MSISLIQVRRSSRLDPYDSEEFLLNCVLSAVPAGQISVRSDSTFR